MSGDRRPRKKNHLIDTRCDLHRVDREFDVHVAFDLRSSILINEFFACFSNHGEPVVSQPIEERLERRTFAILEDCGVVERSQQ